MSREWLLLHGGTAAAWLLAQERFQHLGRRFRQGGSRSGSDDLLTLLTVLTAVAASGWLLAWYVRRRERLKGSSPGYLFRELAAAHQLRWRDRQLLVSFARAHRLAHAAQLFLQPERFTDAGLAVLPNQTDALVDLRMRLFGATMFKPERQ